MRPRQSQHSKDLRGIADRLHSAAIHLLRRLRKQDDATGVSAPRLSALSVVVFAGPLSLKDLAKAEQVRPPTMHRIIRALKQEGYVKIEEHPEDGRSIQILATPKGTKTLSEGRKRRIDLLEALLKPVPSSDLRALDNAIGTLESILAQGLIQMGERRD